MEEIRCKIVAKPERNTKTVIGGGDNYGERPRFAGEVLDEDIHVGNCNLVLVDNVSRKYKVSQHRIEMSWMSIV